MNNREILTLNELKDFIEYLKAFIYDIEICSNNIEQIITQQNSKLNLIPVRAFLHHYAYLSYSHCAITAYKVFHKDEKRSFCKLFNKIREFKFDSELKKLLNRNLEDEDSDNLIKNKDDFDLLIQELTELIDDKTILIDKFKTRRSSFYVHSDPSKITERETLVDLKELCDFAKKIFNILYGRLFNNTFIFSINVASIKQVLKDRKFVDDYYSNLEKQIE